MITEHHLPESPLPGEHVVLLGGAQAGIRARQEGWEVRDSILIVGPQGRVRLGFLLRWPLDGTVAENVLKYGTGALNIDGCRVSHKDKLSISRSDPFHKADGTQKWNPTSSGVIDREQHQAGRWPTNLVFLHGPGCRKAGTKRVHPGGGGVARREKGVSDEGRSVYGGGIGKLAVGTPNLGYVDQDGLETIAAYECEPGCPVADLDQQSFASGIHSAGATREKIVESQYEASSFDMFHSLHGARPMGRYGDSGGASRFYPTFESEAQLHEWLGKLIGETHADP